MCLGELHSHGSKENLHEAGPSEPRCALLELASHLIAIGTESHEQSVLYLEAPMKIRGPSPSNSRPVAVEDQQREGTTVTPPGVEGGTIHGIEWHPAGDLCDSTFQNPIDLTGQTDDDTEDNDHVTDNSTEKSLEVSDLDGAVDTAAERRDNHWVKFDPLKVRVSSL